DGQRERMHAQDLLAEERRWSQAHIAPAVTDVVLQLQKREVMLDIPQQVRQKNEKRGRAADPEPGAGKRTALRGQEQAKDEAGSENQRRILIFEAESSHDAEPD